MWMVDPAKMCPKHLMGEHVELHMLIGTLQKDKSVNGFLKKGLIEPASIYKRHDVLAKEMVLREFAHESPLPKISLQSIRMKIRYNGGDYDTKVDVKKAEADLRKRCVRCDFLFSQ
jgi:hypothetical protein